MKRIKIEEGQNCQKLSLNEAIFQVIFLINNNRFDSALEIVKSNEISLSVLSNNKSIKALEDFKSYMKKQF